MGAGKGKARRVGSVTPSAAVDDAGLPQLLETLEPPEIDERWAEAIEPASKLQRIAAELAANGRRYARFYNSEHELAVSYREQAKAKQAEALALYNKINEPFQAEFERRGGWKRYLIVCNSNGHVHRQPDLCGTLIPGQTMVSPVWQLSGADDDEVIDKYGPVACTKCFPNAPVLTHSDKQRISKEKAEEKKRERAEKQREKDLKKAVRDQSLATKADKLLAEMPSGLGPSEMYNWYYGENGPYKKYGDNAFYVAEEIYKKRAGSSN